MAKKMIKEKKHENMKMIPKCSHTQFLSVSLASEPNTPAKHLDI